MDFEKYIFNKPRPTQPSKPVLKGKSAQDHRNYADELEAWEYAMVEFKKTLQAWYDAKDALHAQFKKDLLWEIGIPNHPKADRIFDMAWNERHDEGLEDVYNFATDLSELVCDQSN